MPEIVSVEKAKEVLDSGIDQAKELIGDKDKVNELIGQVQAKIKDLPLIGSAVEDLPVMISMVKSYITKEYPEVSPKVIATIVSAFLYLVKKKDLIADNIPVIGLLDDIAIAALALNFVKPELDAYRAWKKAKEEAIPASEEA